jgi:phage terminase Nu1 subunit (DNA packaging protein)
METISITIEHPDIIGEDRLAEVIGVQKKTLSRWRKAGLPFFQEQRTIVYQLSEVLDWLKRFRKDQEQKAARNIKSLTLNH